MIKNLAFKIETVIENFLFSHRLFVVAMAILATVVLSYYAFDTKVDASFERMVPTSHPFIENFNAHKNDLKGLGNSLRIAVENTEGTIFEAEFQEKLKAIHDEAFFIEGVDRAGMKSIWSPGVRWQEVTEAGFAGGPVVPSDYDGSPESLEILKTNVLRSGTVGTLVSNDFSSAIVFVPLLEGASKGGAALSYERLSQDLESKIREKYEDEKTKIYITGFAKIVGDLIEGAGRVSLFFLIATIITFAMLILYSRCLRSSVIPLTCSVVAVVWQLGLLNILGYSLDPYSMLVPFLVFAIGVSHGVQVINTFAHELVLSGSRLKAARGTFRGLYRPGTIALLSDAAGFATLLVIDIEVIRQLALTASLGVLIIIFTNIMLLPILLSFTGINGRAKSFIGENRSSDHSPIWRVVSFFATKNYAKGAIVFSAFLVAAGLYYSNDLQIGDLDDGAPELRPESRYNTDNRFISDNYSTSSDVFIVMAVAKSGSIVKFSAQDLIDRFQYQVSSVNGVQSVSALPEISKKVLVGLNEGNIKWYSLNRNQQLMNSASMRAPSDYVNSDATLTPVFIYLNDHKAQTLKDVVESIKSFKNRVSAESEVEFLMAAGNSGIEAATNEVIREAQYEMLFWIYGVVGLLCFLTFRSLKTVICILVPLAITSLLCQALMASMGIGVKVATLPVIALGVGIGVDYGIYIYTKLNSFQNRGYTIYESYCRALMTTGRAVAFTGLTLAIGVGTWAFSPIKFQADMGILLTFMFLVNMIGSLTLLPALAFFLHPKPRAEDSL